MIKEQLQKVHAWSQQNMWDHLVDMQQLEGLMLQAVGGVQELKQQLATQNMELKQVQLQLQKMNASTSEISGHMQHLSSTVESVAAMVEKIYAIMQSGSGGVAMLSSTAPPLIIPRSNIIVTKEALSDACSRACGAVVKAIREGGTAVALKVYNIQSVEANDQKDALREAALLNRACHNNVVRCFGVVHDPDSARNPSIHGSLVMEWVGGGNLCQWLQDNFEQSVGVRVQLAWQVAAGLEHLHKQELVHGDLKPQNILLQFVQGVPLPEV
jgi:serine/threonine protein kinase